MDTSLNLNMDLVRACNNASHFNAGDGIVYDAQIMLERFEERFGDWRGYTDEQIEYIKKRHVEYKELLEKAYNEALSRRASYVPVNVAGPARYPADKMEKRADKALERNAEWQEKIMRFLENTAKGIRDLTPPETILEQYKMGKCSDPIMSDDKYAMEKLKARIECLTGQHDYMKKVNAYYRKHKTCKGYPDLSDEAADKFDKVVAGAYSWEKAGPFKPYQLDSVNKEKKRLLERLMKLQDQKKQGSHPDIIFSGGRIIDNEEEQRVQIKFDNVPEKEIRDKLKGRGFRWSPKAEVWQRLRTPEALRIAKYLLNLQEL